MNYAFSKIWVVVIIIVLIAGGILAWQYFGVPKEDINITPSEKGGHPKLDSVLYQLTQAENYKGFAQMNGLDMVDNKVRVIIELVNPEYTLPTNLGVEETRYKNLLQAIVQIDKLLNLADDSNIKFIRRPMESVPGSPF